MVIEDDVELGANVAVDRATFGRTVVGRGTKVDNLVQIAHNVTIGPHSILVAQVGIAGSTRIGAHVMIGGQAGLADHVEVGDRAMIAGQAGVIRRVEEGQIVSGSPAHPHDVTLRIQGLPHPVRRCAASSATSPTASPPSNPAPIPDHPAPLTALGSGLHSRASF